MNIANKVRNAVINRQEPHQNYRALVRTEVAFLAQTRRI